MPKANKIPRRKVARSKEYGHDRRRRVATLSCGHQKIIQKLGKLGYPKYAPCRICSTRPTPPRTISDAAALKEIYEFMDARAEWNSDAWDVVVNIIMRTGRGFIDPNTSNDDE